ncbi:hypothetical protein DPMN_066838 [Dreissena polymorpha]|uniref:Uncharacterized protein n=1 Tax=Dreissena polymorpha TaxID=45954 RepID=A0A9D4BT65_DREPO|nr:hypothetical protein DPMN_066838 [Dreissena polymorpha]
MIHERCDYNRGHADADEMPASTAHVENTILLAKAKLRGRKEKCQKRLYLHK